MLECSICVTQKRFGAKTSFSLQLAFFSTLSVDYFIKLAELVSKNVWSFNGTDEVHSTYKE